MKITVQNAGHGSGPTVTGTCPHCGHDATFNSSPANDLHIPPNYWLGQRVCPNPKCHGHIFFILEKDEVIRFYPPSKIRFDSTNVPKSVKDTLDEAIDCHANKNFAAAAVMIRRAIDHICQNKQAKGDNLEKRIEALKSIVVLPPELFQGMHNLRMLGNDAAHTEAKVFDEIGEKEVDAGIEFAKKIAEAVYQYSDLLSKLENLKNK